MPLVSVVTSAPPPPAEAQRELLRQLSAALAQELGKPESYVMTQLRAGAAMGFAGSFEPAGLAEVCNIGQMTPAQTTAISQRVCGILAEHLGLEPQRTYIAFHDFQRHLWGWDGKTFAG